MPTATFYPSVTSQPVAGEGAFSNGVDATDWTNITTQATTDYLLTTNEGSLTSPDVNSLTPATPPAITDARLASKFAYTPIRSAALSQQSKMARGITLLRTTDNAAISDIIPANATAITAVVLSSRFADSDYGIDSYGGTGAAVYTLQAQQRNSSGAIGAAGSFASLFDYNAAGLYCYYLASQISLVPVPTVAQVRDTTYGVNFRYLVSDPLESTGYIGINALTITISWTEPDPATSVRRQNVRLRDGRIAAVRARIR